MEGEPSNEMSNEDIIDHTQPRKTAQEIYLENQIIRQVNQLFEDQQLYTKYVRQKGKNDINTLVQANVLKHGRYKLSQLKESLKNLQELPN